MTDKIKINVPDIGGAANVDVIEILVKPGDKIDINTPLVTLESDKASMEIPSPQAGEVGDILVKIGDKVGKGDPILSLLNEDSVKTKLAAPEKASEEKKEETRSEPSTASNPIKAAEETQEITIPDIGSAAKVDVIDILVKEGQFIEKDQPLITLEGDKATMDIPAPVSGEVKKILLRVGDKVAQGSPILLLKMTEVLSEKPSSIAESKKAETFPEEKEEVIERTLVEQEALPPEGREVLSASPAVRRMARELGVNLSEVQGSGRKERVTKEDVAAYIKNRLQGQTSTSGFTLPTVPSIDFSQFGSIETKPLNKIKRLTAQNMHNAWLTIPHVTQFDEADVTDLEDFRKIEQTRFPETKLTLLAFVMKVVSSALSKFPQFNASLEASGEHLIFKKYINIGIAVETPNGLMVPVVKAVDQLSVVDIAKEMARLSLNAREKRLVPAEMSGGSFTISSLGGIGGTAFTPIVNHPEVAILGVSRASIKPVYQDNEFKPRLMLPLSLSYDHRVIDGAEAARFTRYIAEILSDIRRILL